MTGGRQQEPPIVAQRDERFALTTSRHFNQWLAEAAVGIAFTTYQAGKLFFVGLRADGLLSVFERTFARCMGLAVSADGRTLGLATHYQIYRFDNVLDDGKATPDGYDALFAPHACWVTGSLDTHDIAFDRTGRIIFANTSFSCLAAVSDSHSFRPLWRPPFVSKLISEDRCHLNGLAMDGATPRYVTAVAASDEAEGWRGRRSDGGVVIDVSSDSIVASGLSMPHSPRLHAGRLWLLNSGTGEFGHVDLSSGRFEPIAFCPGYARGLAFVGDHAIIGLSHARGNGTFQGLALDEVLKSRNLQARCGLLVVDTRSGETIAWARIEGVVRELYDVAVLPGFRRPSILGFKSEEIQRVISIDR